MWYVFIKRQTEGWGWYLKSRQEACDALAILANNPKVHSLGMEEYKHRVTGEANTVNDVVDWLARLT